MAFIYVRDLIERMTGSRPAPDHDGDLPVHLHGAQFFVRVVGSDTPWVQVFGVAVGGRPLFHESESEAYQQTELRLGPLGSRAMPELPDPEPPPARREASPYL